MLRRCLQGLDTWPTAVFEVEDDTAIGALSAFEDLGLSVPTDVSLVGHNDLPIVSHLPTPPTSVRVPFDQLACRRPQRAADLGEQHRGVPRGTPRA